MQFQLRIGLTVPNCLLISECSDMEYCPISMSAGVLRHSLGIRILNREVLAGWLLLPGSVTDLILDSWRFTHIPEDAATCCSPGLNSSPCNGTSAVLGTP